MTWAGLALSLTGILVAGLALLGEWRDDDSRPDAKRFRRPRRGRAENPWRAELPRFPFRSRTRAQQERFAFSEGSLGMPAGRGVDPDAAEVLTYAEDRMRRRDALAAKAWDEQTDLLRLALDGLEEAFAQQQQAATALQRRTRRRVLLEMVGLLMTAVGTVLATWPTMR